MSKVTGYDERVKTVTWTCSSCGKSHTTAASAARDAGLAGGPPVVAITCPTVGCGALVFVPFNDWRDPASVPDVQAELNNKLHTLRGRQASTALVRLVEVPEKLGGGYAIEGEHPDVPNDAIAEIEKLRAAEPAAAERRGE